MSPLVRTYGGEEETPAAEGPHTVQNAGKCCLEAGPTDKL